MHGLHHPKGDVTRLYIKRFNGGRGLVQFMSTYNCSLVNLMIALSRAKTGFAVS